MIESMLAVGIYSIGSSSKWSAFNDILELRCGWRCRISSLLSAADFSTPAADAAKVNLSIAKLL